MNADGHGYEDHHRFAEPLLGNAKRRAAELNVTLSEVVQDGLRMILTVAEDE